MCFNLSGGVVELSLWVVDGGVFEDVVVGWVIFVFVVFVIFFVIWCLG